MIPLVETLDHRISHLERRVTNLGTKATTTTMQINNERAYVDKNFNQIEPTLTSLTRRMKIVEEVTKNLNCMQEDLQSLNQEMANIS